MGRDFKYMVHTLLIDDNPQLRHEICLGLVDAGHRVTEASNGSEGLTAYKSEKPDLVITDVVMDNGEGVETMRRIHEISPQALVIAIPTHEHYLNNMKKLGAALTLLKPFRIVVLIETIDEIMATPHS